MNPPTAEPSHHEALDSVITRYATLSALTPLIPIPIVDGVIKNRLMRRMVARLAEQRAVVLTERDIEILVDEQDELLAGILKGAALVPLKLLLRKIFFLLTGRRIVQLASQCYHRGWLIDLAFATGGGGADEERSAAEIRRAVDGLMAEVVIANSPVTEALRRGLSTSRKALVRLVASLRKKAADLPARTAAPEAAATAVDDEAAEDQSLAQVVRQLRTSLSEVPRQHFVELEQKFRQRLADAPS